MKYKDVFDVVKDFTRHQKCKIIRKGQAKFQISIEGKEIWIMTMADYEHWCKGRTYWKGNKLFHSRYEIKEQEYAEIL